MKVLIFIHSLAAGGAERVTANLASEWARNGHEITVVTQATRAEDFYRLHERVHRVTMATANGSPNFLMALSNNLTRVIELRKIIVLRQPEMVIGMMTMGNVVAALASIGLGARLILCERTHPPARSLGQVWGRLRRWTYPLASRVVMLTSEGLEWLQREIPRAQGVVIPNPVFYPMPAMPPALPPADVAADDRKVLLTVGRMSEEKGFSGLITAFGSLADQHPQWDLVILGDGPLRSALSVQIQSEGLGNRVLMPGRVGNVGDWYERANLYVLSSRVEGFPNTLAEAMAYGCPVVSFDCDTGPRDLIRHGVDGLLVPPGNITALAHALSLLMSNNALRAQMAAQAPEVRSRYSMQRISNRWLDLFTEISRQRRSKNDFYC